MSLFTISVFAERFDWSIYAEPENDTISHDKDCYYYAETETWVPDAKTLRERFFILSTSSNKFKSGLNVLEGSVEISLADLNKNPPPPWFITFSVPVDFGRIGDSWKTIPDIDFNRAADVIRPIFKTKCLGDPYCYFKSRITFEYLKPSKTGSASVTVKDKVKPLYGSEELSNIYKLVNDPYFLYNLGFTLKQPAAIASSNPKILIGFSPDELTNTGDVTGVYSEATDFKYDVVYVCLDADENNDCDFHFAQDACWNDGFDFYKNKCCGVGAEVEPDTFNSDVNAFCTEDVDDNPVWIPLEYTGEIFELDNAALVPRGDYFRVCGDIPSKIADKSVQIQDNSFFGISLGGEEHQYYCKDKKLLECGGDFPFSSNNFVNTGHKLETVQPVDNFDTYFCAYYFDSSPGFIGMIARWRAGIDAPKFNYTCTQGGFTFTGTKCCGEFPDETYEDPWTTKPLSETPGICEDSEYLADGTIFDDDEFIVFKGSKLSCNEETENICENLLLNIDDEDNAALCTPLGWIKGDEADFQDLTLKSTSWTTDIEDSCCKEDECWDGISCVGETDSIEVDDEFYYCTAGNWVAGTPKSDWNNVKKGMCSLDSQCLVDPLFNFDNTNPVDFWNVENQDRPRCIDDKEYILDHYCDNGEWTSRTKLLAESLYGFSVNSQEDFALYCDSPEKVLLNILDLENSCEINDKLIPCVNNICAVRINDDVILAATLNVDVDDSDSFLVSLGLDEDICTSGTNFLSNCGQGVYYTHNIQSVIYSPDLSYSDEFSSDYFDNKFTSLNSYVDSLPPNLLTDTDYEFFKKPSFSNVFIARANDNEIFSFLELDKTDLHVNYLGVDFKNINLGSNSCNIFKKFQRTHCENQNIPQHFYLTAYEFPVQGSPIPFPVRHLTDYWQSITSSLRLK